MSGELEKRPTSIRRLLVAVDDSPRAPDVFAVAAELGRATGASLRVFQAIGLPAEIPPAAHVEGSDHLASYVREEARLRLEGHRATASDLLCDIDVAESQSAWHAILAAAERFDADLIILGSHRHTMLDHLLGTTAAKVVDHAKRDVLVVRRQTRARAS